LAVLAALHVVALLWFAKTGSISILDLLRVNVRGNAFSTDPAAEMFCGLIQDPGPLALHADVSHFSISLKIPPPASPCSHGGRGGGQALSPPLYKRGEVDGIASKSPPFVPSRRGRGKEGM